VKTALDAWSKSTDTAQAQYTIIMNAELALEQAYGTLGTAMVQMSLDRDAVVTALESVRVTADDAKSFGADAVVPGKPVEPVPPTTIRVIPTDVQGTDRIRWPSEPGAASYVAEQSIVDPPTDASWTPCYTGMSPFFFLKGT